MSNSHIDRCGRLLMSQYRGEPVDPAELQAARLVVTDFRAAHASPLLKTRVDLGRVVAAETSEELVVSQRQKRLDRIVRKLDRMGNTRLSSLQDIGGCRAVLPNLAELRRVQTRLLDRWPDAKVRNDYIDQPTPMGYRAVHIVVRRDDRLIEVQLRTGLQQAWADAVETIDGRQGTSLKDEIGPASWLRYLDGAARLLFESDCGRVTSEEFTAQIIALSNRLRVDLLESGEGGGSGA